MNLILGSGIIGNLAKRILGDKWEFIPFKRSRYFSFDMPYADNFIRYDDKVTDFISQINPAFKTPIFYKCPISFHGQLMFQDLPSVVEVYLQKIYGDKVPEVARLLLKSTFSVYQLSCKELHDRLEKENMNSIQEGKQKFGDLISIDLEKKTIECKNGRFEFDKIISTIPLSALSHFCGKPFSLQSKPICYYTINTDAINLEGASQSLVADEDIKFFKVSNVGMNTYVFQTLDAVDYPSQYFGQFLNYRIDILEAKRIEDALPIGDAPNLDRLKQNGVYCIGSNAEHDDFRDVSTCIKKLMNLQSELNQ